LSAEELLGHLVAKSLEAPHAADLMRTMVDSERYRLLEIDLPPELVGITLSGVRARRSELVLAVVRDGQIMMGVNDDPVLGDADRLVMLSPSESSHRR